MDQPLGFLSLKDSRLICKLQRSLYDLKQSTRARFGCFSFFLIQFGMTKCEANHSIFSFHSSSSECIYLVIYVDDIFIMDDDETRIQ